MAYQWWVHAGEPQRSKFVCLKMSYHGDTLGSVAVGGIELFHSRFEPLLFECLPGDAGRRARPPVPARRARRRDRGGDRRTARPGRGGDAAPAAGLPARGARDVRRRRRVPDLRRGRDRRSGAPARCSPASRRASRPDFLCLAKGLTGGYLPLAATLTTERVYDGFLGEFEAFRTFFHGHTYTGNPLGCAAALATLEVFEQERTLEALQPKIALLAELLDQQVARLPGVREIRRIGFMVAIELDEHPVADRIGHQVTLAARERGAIVRPLGDAVVLMPPLSISTRRTARARRDHRRVDRGRGRRSSVRRRVGA